MCFSCNLSVLKLTTIVVRGGGFGAGTTSCKCHEMSSIKNVCGEGWVERGFYLPEEGEVRVRAREPLVPE